MLFRFGKFCSLLLFTDSFLSSPVGHWAHLLSWVLYFSGIKFAFVFSLYLLSLCLHFLFLCWDFQFVSFTFITAHWNIFIMAASKLLSHNSDISVILVLASMDFLTVWDIPGSWYKEWFIMKRGGFYIMLWILFKSLVLACFSDTTLEGKGVGPLLHYCQASVDTWVVKGMAPCYYLGVDEISGSPCNLSWHHRGGVREALITGL